MISWHIGLTAGASTGAATVQLPGTGTLTRLGHWLIWAHEDANVMWQSQE